MKEESHLEEMRAAVRGDRERAEDARRRTLENVGALIEAAPPKPPEPEKRSWLRGLLGPR